MTRRLVLDVSSLVRWSGPPVGIARVEHALAARAARRPDAVPAVFDRGRGAWRAIRPKWRDVLLGWHAIIEDSFNDPPRRGWRALVPSRKPVVTRLEAWRLTAPAPVARLADAAQHGLLALRRHKTPLRDASGRRVARPPSEMALEEALELGPEDTLFTAGAGWGHGIAEALARGKAREGFRHVTLCYDLIPVTHPAFWFPKVVEGFRDHWRTLLPACDLVVANARCIAADLRRFAADNGIPPPDVTVLPLGYDPPPPAAPAPLPAGLEAGRYALFVSTIEPRKGHMTLLRAWRSLLDRGVPQRGGFRLVLVGREGWMVDDVLAALKGDWGGTVLHLQGVDGPTLDALYAGAAFGLYPSVYEGFGLPIIEAFARGKAVLTSTGGAVPETVGDLSPTLPPGEPDAWAAAMESWITDPAARAAWEARIKAGFSHPDWDTAAGAILDAVMAVPPGPVLPA